MTALAAEPQATRREWIGLAIIALPCMLYSMDLTVLNLAVPQLSADLAPSASQLLWIVDLYGFMIAGSLITMGTLGDRIGRRRLLLIGAVAFGLASVLAAFSTSAEMLIAARAMLGVAGATLAPSTLSLIRNMFLDPRQRTVAISVWITSFSVGGALGPLVGGILLQYFWWGSVFLVAVPVMVMLLALGPVLLPEYRDPEAGRLDLLSAALSLAAVLAVIFGLKQAAENGFGSLPAISILAGLVLGLVFLRRQRKLADPLIDLALFRSPAFSTSLGVNISVFFVFFGSFLFMAQYLQLVIGLPPLQAGLWSLPSTIGFIAVTMSTPAILRRVRPAYVMGASLVAAAVGFGVMTQIGGDNGLAILVTASIIFSMGLAPVITLATDMIVGAAPPERAGSAAALSETGSEFGGALGIAVLGSVGTAIYRSRMAADLPGGVEPELAETARDTLGGAVGVAEGMAGHLAGPLIEAARDAFVQGLQTTAAISVVVALVAAAAAVMMLRHIEVGADHGE
jgi:DHA2 family multidrug resistance protein-like MFS transporter